MKQGKAAGLGELTVEHIVNSHPVLISILTRLFNLIMSVSHVPYGFRLSYTVPLPKEDKFINVTLLLDNYRAISISPVISKVFEHCVSTKFSKFFYASPNQFGFKKKSSCVQAMQYTLSEGLLSIMCLGALQ